MLGEETWTLDIDDDGWGLDGMPSSMKARLSPGGLAAPVPFQGV
jgi:hypothetical protein